MLKIDKSNKKSILLVPAVVDVEIGSHNRSREESSMSSRHSINHSGYCPPVDMPGNTQTHTVIMHLLLS